MRLWLKLFTHIIIITMHHKIWNSIESGFCGYQTYHKGTNGIVIQPRLGFSYENVFISALFLFFLSWFWILDPMVCFNVTVTLSL